MKLIMEQNAYVYICGDGNQMAKDVDSTLHEILMQHSTLSHADVKAALIDMRQRRRYVFDIWS